MRYPSKTGPMTAPIVICAAIIIISLITASVSFASSSSRKNALRPAGAEIDMIVTGARISANKSGNSSFEAAVKGECALCFHRELMKINSQNNIKKASQPYPAD